MEYYLLDFIFYFAPDYSSFLFALAVSPIIAITTIIVSMMVGVFRGYGDQNLPDLPPTTLIHRIIRATE